MAKNVQNKRVKHSKVKRRIILLSDGTGNSVGKVWRTNVWRMYESLDLSGDDQVALYDDGVGSSRLLPLAILGGAFGWGLKRNVIHLYKYLCRNHTDKADIFIFGFSRGAFTARILADFILDQGLIGKNVTESDLDRYARVAYRTYKSKSNPDWKLSLWYVVKAFRRLLDRLDRRPYDQSKNTKIGSIRFLGLWDSVAAYGLPIEEMTIGFDRFFWPLTLPNEIPSTKIKRICHALSLDDERTTFHPVLFSEENGRLRPRIKERPPTKTGMLNPLSDERLSQVWFAGVHANVGGGYPDDSLAHVPLTWVMKEAKDAGLKFKKPPSADPNAQLRIKSAADKDGRLYDSRAGLASYYRYGPRDVGRISQENSRGELRHITMPKIHFSALKRIRQLRNGYAPIGLPSKYAVVDANCKVQLGTHNEFGEKPVQLKGRLKHKERIWNLVWWRRFFYFATVLISGYLLTFWLYHDHEPAQEFASPIRWVSELVRLIGSFLPNFTRWWLDFYAANPVQFSIGLSALVTSLICSSWLRRKITDEMGSVWRRPEIPTKSTIFDPVVSGLRNSYPYKATISFLKHLFFPTVFAVVVVWLVGGIANRVMFNIADHAGLYCKGNGQPLTVGVNHHLFEGFHTRDLCAPTGLLLQEGHSYELILSIPSGSAWYDRTVPTNLFGYTLSEIPLLQTVKKFVAVPYRRIMFRRWFRVIARIGEIGGDEYFIDPPAYYPPAIENRLRIELTARRSGELFFYVNDTVLAPPFAALSRAFGYSPQPFYDKNMGKAQICIRDISPQPIRLPPSDSAKPKEEPNAVCLAASEDPIVDARSTSR